MERTRAFDIIVSTLSGIAPEIDPLSIDPAADLRFEFDLDSMDFMSLVEGVARAAAIDIPERDYAALDSLDGFADYVASRST
jgi:acyl carrier protein